MKPGIQHKNDMGNMKQILIAISVLLTVLSGTSWAQGSKQPPRRTAYESALLDSAYRYELLKPTFYSLRSTYESQSEEITNLRNTVRLQNLQAAVQKQNFETALIKEKQSGGFWRGFKWGFGVGFGSGLLTGLRARK